jgi:hypothetical protein
MSESFVKTVNRDYVRCNPRPGAQTVLAQLESWFEDYNDVHPHRGLKMLSRVSLFKLIHHSLRAWRNGGNSTSHRKVLRQRRPFSYEKAPQSRDPLCRPAPKSAQAKL